MQSRVAHCLDVMSHHFPLIFPCFFLTLAVLRGIDQVSCRRSLNSSLYDIFLIIRQDCVGLWKEYHRSEPPLSSHISGNMWYPHDIIGDMNLHHLGNMVFARFVYWRITIFLFVPSILWKWVTKCSSHLRWSCGVWWVGSGLGFTYWKE